jgi:ribonuclease G
MRWSGFSASRCSYKQLHRRVYIPPYRSLTPFLRPPLGIMALTFVQRLKQFFTGKKDIKVGTRIAINCEPLENRVALIDNGKLEEYTIERVGQQTLVGSIYKGRIKNIEMGLKAMFVDIGQEKNAFLHFWDAIPAAIESGFEEIQRGPGKKGKKKLEAKDIPTLYPVGSEIMVQVTKGPIGNKGPRVTTNISLAGRLLVLMPLNEQFGISRKVEDPKERARLREILQKLDMDEGMGVIMRTEAVGKRARHIVRDLSILIDQWHGITEKRDHNNAPVCCFQEPDVLERTVRDFLTDDVDEVICDDKATVERMQEMAGQVSNRAKRRITFYSGQGALFDAYGVQKQIDNAFYRQVWLPCGGYIVIDQTEALVAIDVNTGRNKGTNDGEKVILETNLEAAAEVARQLRLRNMGGLIVVDFIDMKQQRDRQAVYKAGQGEDPDPSDQPVRPHGNDSSASERESRHCSLRRLPALQRTRPDQDTHHHVCGATAETQQYPTAWPP